MENIENQWLDDVLLNYEMAVKDGEDCQQYRDEIHRRTNITEELLAKGMIRGQDWGKNKT